jgi:hypothetical protein
VSVRAAVAPAPAIALAIAVALAALVGCGPDPAEDIVRRTVEVCDRFLLGATRPALDDLPDRRGPEPDQPEPEGPGGPGPPTPPGEAGPPGLPPPLTFTELEDFAIRMQVFADTVEEIDAPEVNDLVDPIGREAEALLTAIDADDEEAAQQAYERLAEAALELHFRCEFLRGGRPS